MSLHRRIVMPLIAVTALAVTSGGLATAQGARSGGIKAQLTLDPQAAKTLGYFPIQVELSDKKPSGVSKEPVYKSTPKYGVIHLGDGPRSAFVVALDEPADGNWRIYVDANGNGNLTDDGDGAWSKKMDRGGRTLYGPNEYTLRASWGAGKRETGSGNYGIAIYRFSNLKPLLMYRTAGRVGTIEIAGKTHKAMLAENDANALFSKPLDDAGKPVGGGAESRPVWLLIDMNDDGKFANTAAAPEMFDARAPFKLGDKVYEAKVAVDGSKIELTPTTRAAYVPKQPEAPALLAAGTPAPDFTAEKWGGGALKLSDYKGKIVLLDFWATWCGPCQKSMPHLQKVFQAVKDQGVEVLGVCSWDEKPAYEQWVPANKEKYGFTFAYDPAGRQNNNIAGAKFKVSGIPTTYIIGRDGKVAATVVGYDDGDKRIEDALTKLGLKLSE